MSSPVAVSGGLVVVSSSRLEAREEQVFSMFHFVALRLRFFEKILSFEPHSSPPPSLSFLPPLAPWRFEQPIHYRCLQRKSSSATCFYSRNFHILTINNCNTPKVNFRDPTFLPHSPLSFELFLSGTPTQSFHIIGTSTQCFCCLLLFHPLDVLSPLPIWFKFGSLSL